MNDLVVAHDSIRCNTIFDDMLLTFSICDRSACTWGEFEQYNIQHILSKYNTHSFMLPVLIYLQTIDEERALHFICENDKNYFEKANKEQQIWGALRQDHKR